MREALIFATILSVAVLLGLFGWIVYDQKQQLAALQQEVALSQSSAELAASQLELIQQELTNSHTRIETLLKEKEQVTAAQKRMEEQMRDALQTKDVTISELQGKLTVNIVDRVLFDSGEAQLKPEGENVLAKVAGVLTQHTNRQIYVIGHTDNVPIRASAFSRYSSNWELSTARATAAVRFLTEKAGVDPKMLAAVGYGEFHPIADNSTAEGRARNRRIAIVVMPEQFSPLESPELLREGPEQTATNSASPTVVPADINSLPRAEE